MYLTKLVLNIRNKYVLHNMSNCEWVHRLILEKGFSDIHGNNPREALKILYNLNGNTILVQSAIIPHFNSDDYLFDSVSNSIDLSKMKELFQPEKCVRVTCTCNPSKKTKEGKRVFLITQELRDEWFKRKMSEAGAEVLITSQSPEITISGFKTDRISGKNHKITARAVTFTGAVSITDPDLFWTAFCNGIGHEKAYGCGMLMVTR